MGALNIGVQIVTALAVPVVGYFAIMAGSNFLERKLNQWFPHRSPRSPKRPIGEL